jgi:2'-5' RNA ligase
LINLRKLFIAIDISDDVATYLADYVKKSPALRTERLVPVENYHITAHFIGLIDEKAVVEIEDLLRTVVPRQHPFELQLKEITPAPPGRKYTMLWGVFEDSREFIDLTDDLRATLGKFGSDTKERVPHVTLARFRRPRVDLRCSPGGGGTDAFLVDRLTLMESLSIPGGVYYRSLGYFPFGKWK